MKYQSNDFYRHPSDPPEDLQPLTEEHYVAVWTTADVKLSLSSAGTSLMFPWLFRVNSNSGWRGVCWKVSASVSKTNENVTLLQQLWCFPAALTQTGHTWLSKAHFLNELSHPVNHEYMVWFFSGHELFLLHMWKLDKIVAALAFPSGCESIFPGGNGVTNTGGLTAVQRGSLRPSPASTHRLLTVHSTQDI